LTLLSVLSLSALAAGDIRVGQSIALSGAHGDVGKDYLAGARVYFDAINSKGGVRGHKIVLDARDNGDSPAKSAEITRDFLGKDKVDVLFGYYGEGSLTAVIQNKAFAQSGMALVAPLSGTVPGTPGNVFFLRPSYATEAKSAIDYYVKQGLKRFALIHSQNSYGESAAQAVTNELRSQHLPLLSQQAVNEDDDAQVGSAVQRIAAAKPQVVMVIMESIPAAQFIKAYRQRDQGVRLLGLSQLNSDTVAELAGAEAAGTVISQVVPHPNDQSLAVVREFNKQMKKYRDEAPTHLTLEGYLAAKLLVDALTQAGGDPTRLAATFKTLHDTDFGGFYASYAGGHHRASSYVDINAISRDGRLIN
jgi:ABC-type branched-subunit amino acid transport system substrate-binding protein